MPNTANIAADLLGLVVPIDRLEPLPGNPRRGDVDAIARSYAAFGQRKPVVARRTSPEGDEPSGVVIAGNHSLAAARQLGWDGLAVVWTDDDEATGRAFALADNRTADLGSYDDELLAEMLTSVQDFPDLLTATGYSDDDLSALLASLVPDEPPPVVYSDPDDVPEPPPPKTVKGDVWLLGPHRVLCGDCREPSDVDRLLAGASVNLAFTSPPYADRRVYDEDSGFRPVPPEEYVEWFQPVAANVAAHLAIDGSWFVNIKEHAEDGQRHLYVYDLAMSHVRSWDWRFVDELVWLDAANGMPGYWPNRFKDAWERVYHFARDHSLKFRPDAVATASDNVPVFSPERWGGLTADGYVQREDWDRQPGMAKPSNVVRVKAGGEGGHSAAFPVGLPEWFVRAYTDPGDTVFDPFMGSGSTLIAAHKQERIGYGLEISPRYTDVICKRFQAFSGIVPILEATGREHDFLAE